MQLRKVYVGNPKYFRLGEESRNIRNAKLMIDEALICIIGSVDKIESTRRYGRIDSVGKV